MVTKRPLVLQLINSDGPGLLVDLSLMTIMLCSISTSEYAVFGHKPHQKFVNYAEVRAEIENDTKAVVRDDMGVSNIPINLTIFSPHGKSSLCLFAR